MPDAICEAAFLIDADNLSPEGVTEALGHLQALEVRLTVRRAYGSHETLAAMRDFLQANSMRAMVNQGKGTTDAALVVDAMDLLHVNGLPSLVAIGSGDGDFAPLVVRLREAGIRLLCFAQKHKAGEGLDRVYDEVIHVDSPAPARGAVKRVAQKASAKKAVAPPAPAPVPALVIAPASESQRVWTLLQSVPGFKEGHDVALNEVVKKLKDEKLMAKSTSTRNFFKKHAPDVELFPATQPNKLRLLPGPR